VGGVSAIGTRPRAATIRPATADARRATVERVLETMVERFAEPLMLHDLAELAFLSPYHFNRVFRLVTGVPPGRFLTTLRMQEAKRLLLTTSLRVTDICFEVGYQSLGTFTTHFRQHVGVGPCPLRSLAEAYADVPLEALLERTGTSSACGPAVVRGRVRSPDGFDGVAFVGLFPQRLPQGRPSTCAVLAAPGEVELRATPASGEHALASAFPRSGTIFETLLPEPAETRVAASRVRPARGGRGSSSASLDLRLRPVAVTDPPVLLAIALLLADAAGGRRARPPVAS
jgi:AraC family transcriptional regulator